MRLEDKLKSFCALGDSLNKLDPNEWDGIIEETHNNNNWFEKEEIKKALKNIAKWLDKKKLENWLKNYKYNTSPKQVGVIMAGNIPLVNFHDLLCVILSGHRAVCKLSSKDIILGKAIIQKLYQIDKRLKDYISFDSPLKNIDAIIATGSNNSFRYFETYFGHLPNIFRKSRTSLAILNGKENLAELERLATDVFDYFGFGCRSISKLLLPEGFDPTKILQAFEYNRKVIENNKYKNNLDYNLSILLLNQSPHFHSDFLILQENENLFSPVATLYYQFYKDDSEITNYINKEKENIQCVLSSDGYWDNSIAFGEAQSPELTDYADHIDSMLFLENL